MTSVFDLNLLQLAIILAAGIAAGFINTLAGGGSLLTIPALLFAGIPASIANGTNRVAVVMQSAAGAASFRRKNVFVMRDAVPMLIPAFVGSIAGALVAVELDPRIFDIVLGIVLLMMVVTLFIKPASVARPGEERQRRPILTVVAFLGIGFYGGFVQAGVGFLLIIGINTLFGFDLVKTNALKLLVVALYSLFALAIFAFYGQVLWLHGLVLGLGNVAGALIGVRFALKRGAGAIRWVIVVAVVLTALKLFGVLG